jgi:hypothetical protein
LGMSDHMYRLGKWPTNPWICGPFAEEKWFFHCDNALINTSVLVQDWLAIHSIHVLDHLPYLPDLALADSFFFQARAGGRQLRPQQPQDRVGRGHKNNQRRRAKPAPSSGGMRAANSYVRKSCKINVLITIMDAELLMQFG